MKITDKHPEYNERLPQWERCEAAFAGGDAIKAGGELYLPRLPGQSDTEYANYRMRAIWYDACRATLDLYTGMVFSRAVQYTGIDASSEIVADADMAGEPYSEILEDALEDVIKFGRFGLLVDYAGETGPDMSQADALASAARPYVAEYDAVDILDWETARVGGRMMVVRVLLQDEDGRLRELTLGPTGYQVQLWKQDKELEWHPDGPARTPIMRGRPLPFIPFFFFDAEYGSSECETPPLLGLVDINLSHYRTMADLEHGRFFCGLPTPVFAGFQFEEGTKIALGSMSGISSPEPSARAYYLEFSGQGLAALERAATQKEAWLSHLGGGLLNPDTTGAEAAETMKIRRSGANATLASIASAVSMVGSKVLSLLSEWAGGSPDVSVALNTEYLPASITPQEIDSLLRAVQSGDYRRLDFLKRLQTAGAIAQDADLDMINKELGDPAQGTLNPIGGVNG